MPSIILHRLRMRLGFLARKRRCSCGCILSRPGTLSIFKGLKLVVILSWGLIWAAGKAAWKMIGGIWEDNEIDLAKRAIDKTIEARRLSGKSSASSSWKCDLCGRVGEGNVDSFFSLDEIEHFLETGCKGSLRPHAESELETKLNQPEETSKIASAVVAVQERDRRPGDTTTCLSSSLQDSIILGHGSAYCGPRSIAVGLDVQASDEPAQIDPEREIVCGFGSIRVEAGQTLFINAGTKVSFKVRRLVVPSSVAEHFMINGLILGSLQLLSNSYPAILFTENSSAIRLRGEELKPPNIITVSVTNMSRKWRWFQGALIGLAPVENSVSHNANQVLNELMFKMVELKRDLEKEKQLQGELLQKVQLQEQAESRELMRARLQVKLENPVPNWKRLTQVEVEALMESVLRDTSHD